MKVTHVGSRVWSRLATSALLAAVSAGGIVCSISPAAFAQESFLGTAREATQKAPASADAALAYGKALRRAGRENEALTELRRGQMYAKERNAIEIDWEIARTLIAKRDFQSTMNACGAIRKLPNGLAASHACAAEGHLLWRRGTEALAETAEVRKLPSVSTDVLYAIDLAEGRSHELASRDAEAEASYRAAIAQAPNRDGGHVLLGALLQRTGKDGTAELRKAVELDPHDPVNLVELGRVLLVAPAHRSEGIASFETALAERPAYVEALRSLTDAYIAAGRLADAKRTASAVLKAAPNDVAAHLVSGRVALAEGRPDDALKEGDAALKLIPNEASAKLLVADAYAKKGEIDLALEAYQKASGLDPENPAPLVHATYACIQASRLTSAKAFGQRAVLDFPTFSPSWVAQGDALAADGNPKAARTAYESAKKAKNADLPSIDGKISSLK